MDRQIMVHDDDIGECYTKDLNLWLENSRHETTNAHHIHNYLKNGLSIEQAMGRFFLKEYSNHIFEIYRDKKQFIDDMIPLIDVQRGLESAEITDIWYSFKTGILTIQLCRPGIFIGVKGADFERTFDTLSKWAKKVNLNLNKIQLKEDCTPLKSDLFNSIIFHQYGTNGRPYI